jgi:hypothetical protein
LWSQSHFAFVLVSPFGFPHHVGYDEREREGYKYVVAERQVKSGAEGVHDQQLQAKRKAKRERAEDVFLGGTLLDDPGHADD